MNATAISFQTVRPVGDVWYWAAWTEKALREGYRPDAKMAGEAADRFGWSVTNVHARLRHRGKTIRDFQVSA